MRTRVDAHRMGTPHLRRRFGHIERSLVDEIVAGDASLSVVLVGDPQPDQINLG